MITAAVGRSKSPQQLIRSQAVITCREAASFNDGVRRVSRRVKRCRHGAMALRWVATAALESAKGFRRLRGHADIPKLISALRALDAKLDAANAGASIRKTG